MATQREQRRLVHLKGQVSVGDSWRSATICNVSSRGLMAKCSEPPAKGAVVEVRHHGFNALGEVAWVHGERFGVRCPTPVDLPALHGGTPEVRIGRRALPRMTVRIAGEFVLREHAFNVLLIDISQSGARVHMPLPPLPGVKAALSWAQHEFACTVLWAKGDVFGIEFEEVLPREVVSKLRAGPARRKTRQLVQPIWPKPQIPPHLRNGVGIAERRARDRRGSR
jgi:hypothetical protein